MCWKSFRMYLINSTQLFVPCQEHFCKYVLSSKSPLVSYSIKQIKIALHFYFLKNLSLFSATKSETDHSAKNIIWAHFHLLVSS